MLSEPRWLDPDDVVELNRLETTRTAEPFNVRDFGLLESALAVPANLFHYNDQGEVGYLAASLLVAVARNHPFEQGNKRTALAAALLFAALNGYYWDAPDEDDEGADDFAQHLLNVLNHKMAVSDFSRRFAEYLRPI